jgi:hypothetical protein
LTDDIVEAVSRKNGLLSEEGKWEEFLPELYAIDLIFSYLLYPPKPILLLHFSV